MKLMPTSFRVLNYRNIDDSGWIPLERVTAFVGRNESGKTSLLKALHKFNPATAETYSPQREFPRDRFTSEYHDSHDSPVCQVEFEFSEEFRKRLGEKLNIERIPEKATLTRHFDGSLKSEYDVELPDDSVDSSELVKALEAFAKGARRLIMPNRNHDEETQKLRTQLANWADHGEAQARKLHGLRTEEGIALLERLGSELNGLAGPKSAELVETLQEGFKILRERAETLPISKQLDNAVRNELPVFIYFENYGILDSSIHLKRFLEDLETDPDGPRVRTINAMFKHLGLTAEEISSLGQTEAMPIPVTETSVTPEMIIRNQERADLRSMKLNSASNDISNKFNRWFGQRQHKIRYHADGQYFRIWVSDDRRPNVDIELESRSKGFQWFFSFYLMFLTESNEGHKDAILLLDEPGLHLHPTAQQELIAFFEKLSETNPLIYTTHSPFLIDGEHLHRIRPITEDDTGHSRIDVDGWPADRETIFPLQAAAGYAMVKGLFQHRKNLLVEGLSDYLYLHALNLQCRALKRKSLPEDIYVTPCGGTKLIGHFASLFLGQGARPVILLDSDDAGRIRRDALTKELYAGQNDAVLMLSAVLQQEECGMEDIFGESMILPVLNNMVERKIVLEQADRDKGSLVAQIRNAAQRHHTTLPEGWKPDVARRIVVEWSTRTPTSIPPEILDKAEALFTELARCFDDAEP